jgi:1,4-alpha-glucan branching enzyme
MAPTADQVRQADGPLRVCLVSHFARPSTGGVETYTDGLARYLAARGHRVVVLTATPGNLGDGTYEIARRPATLRLLRIFWGSDVIQFNSLNPFLFALARVLGKPTIDVHHDFHAICPIGTAWWRGRACAFDPRLCGHHLAEERGLRGVIRPVVAFLARRLATRQADANVVMSGYAIRRLRVQRVLRIPNGIEPPDRRDLDPAERRNARDFLFVGRLVPGKGIDVLLRAFRRLAADDPDPRVIICGSGPEEKELRELAAELDLDDRVSFIGNRSPAEVRRLMSGALALVVPSLSDETGPIVVPEAFSVGTPVIAADAGGLGEVTGKGGLVFERGNASELAALMAEMVRRPQLRQELSAGGRRSFDSTFSLEVMGAAYLSLYRQLVVRPS